MSFTNDDLIAALFKEYLQANSFTKTHQSFQEEVPLSVIQKRTQMIDALGLMKQAREENEKKKNNEPYIKSTLELLIKEYLNKSENDNSRQKMIDNILDTQIEKKPVVKRLVSKKKVHREDKTTEKQPTKPLQKEEETTDSIWSTSKTTKSAEDSIWSSNKPSNTKQQIQPKSNLNLLPDYLGNQLTSFLQILFNERSQKTISDNWYQALYRLSSAPIALENPQTWGLHQANGGPCGALAVIQARMLKYIFKENNFEKVVLKSLQDTFEVINPKKTIFVLPNSFSEPELQLDFVIQEMKSFHVIQVENQNLSKFLNSSEYKKFAFSDQISSFLPCFVLSAVLSRGVKEIQGDYDNEQSSLFTNFNNCSQELVNLLINGKATSGVHDGEMDVGGMNLKGVDKKCDVGLVTIYEFFDYLTVGDHLKYAENDIWVCFNEGHYTVLFKLAEDRFIYYDQLDDQREFYDLKVEFDEDRYEKGERESFVENLLQTLGPVVSVDWRGVDKLL